MVNACINRTSTALDRGCVEQSRLLTAFGYREATKARVIEAHGRWKRDEPPVDIIDRYCFTAFNDRPALFGTMDMA